MCYRSLVSSIDGINKRKWGYSANEGNRNCCLLNSIVADGPPSAYLCLGTRCLRCNKILCKETGGAVRK